MVVEKLNLIKKEIDKSGEYGFPVTETRWFVETGDGFDGTAQGYGFKSPQALYKAYSYFHNRNKIKSTKDKVKNFLENNPDVKTAIENYCDADWMLDRIKDGDPTSIPHMIELISEDNPKVVEKLNANKSLWNEILKYIINN